MNKTFKVFKFIVLAPINLVLIIFNGFSYLCELMSKGFFFYFKKLFDFLYYVFPKCNIFNRISSHYKKRQKQPEVFLLLVLYFVSFISIFSLTLSPDYKKENNEKYVNSIISNDGVVDDGEVVENNSNNTNTSYFGWNYRDFMKTSLDKVDFSMLKNKNSDTVSWINVDGTYINYPVVQTSDNEYYLNHSFNKEKKQSGWIFMDYRNHNDMTDKNTIFYGHNLLNDNAFGSLDLLFQEDWINDSNKKIVVLTENKQCIYEIFSVYYSDPTSYYLQVDFDSGDVYLNFLNNLKEKSNVSISSELSVDDRIITLSTCTDDNIGRKVVHAKLVYEGVR